MISFKNVKNEFRRKIKNVSKINSLYKLISYESHKETTSPNFIFAYNIFNNPLHTTNIKATLVYYIQTFIFLNAKYRVNK